MTLLRGFRLTAGIGAMAIAAAAWAAPTVDRSVQVAPGGLYEIVFNPADNDIYIAAIGPRGAQGAAVVARLDGRTLAAETPISVATNPLYGLGLNSRTQTLYGTDTRGGVVSAVDLRTGQIVANITDGNRAHLRQVVIDENANRVYVSVVGTRPGQQNENPNQIWVIDGANNSLDRIITVDAGALTGIALDAANNRIFGTGMGSNDVVVVDLGTDRTVARWPTGTEGPTNVVHDATGNRLFVVSQGSGELTVLSSTDGSVIRRVPTGEGALSLAFNPAVNQVYVANRRAGTVTVVDSNSYEVVANLTTGTFPQTIAIDRATNTVYVTNKARGLPRGAPAGTPVAEDPEGDTVTIILP